MISRTIALGAALAAALSGWGCGPKEQPYQQKPAYSGKKANLPAVPALPNKSKKEGDAYTVWGAMHDLHSEVHMHDFDGKEVSLVGYIVRSNVEAQCKDDKKFGDGEEPCVPKCAIHKQGKADPDDCVAPIPAFWIAEHNDEKDYKAKAIPIKGWSSNFAAIFSMVEKIDTDDEKAEIMDNIMGTKLPNPLPAVGAKVKVTGNYGVTAATGSKGSESNPRTGIMKMTKIEYIEVPEKRAVLPGMKVRNPNNKRK